VVIGTDYIGSCKSNYHRTTTTSKLYLKLYIHTNVVHFDITHDFTLLFLFIFFRPSSQLKEQLLFHLTLIHLFSKVNKKSNLKKEKKKKGKMCPMDTDAPPPVPS